MQSRPSSASGSARRFVTGYHTARCEHASSGVSHKRPPWDGDTFSFISSDAHSLNVPATTRSVQGTMPENSNDKIGGMAFCRCE
jgi:hypothetical protein